MQGSIWLHMLIVALVLVKSAGCFPAGSKISTLDGRRAGWFPAGSQMSTADGRRSDTGPDDAPGGLFLTSAGNAIVLDHSELSLLDCPGQATNSTIALTSHGGPIHKEMFEGLPFIVGGSKFGCVDSMGQTSPFYLRALGEPMFDVPQTTARIHVRVAELTEIVYGKARFEADGSHDDRSAPPDEASRRFTISKAAAVAESVIVPDTGCIYNDHCKSKGFPALAGMAQFGYQACPTTHPYPNILTISKKWKKTGYAGPPLTEAVNDACDGEECTCEDAYAVGVRLGSMYVWHCCGESHKDSFKMEYEKNAIDFETTVVGSGVAKGSQAKLSLKVVVAMEIEATQTTALDLGILKKNMYPSGLKSLEAYVEGSADIVVKLKAKQFKTEAEVSEAFPKTEVGTYTFMLGYLPVKVKLEFGAKAAVKGSVAYTLADDVTFFAQAKGSIKFGGKLEGTVFTPYKDWTGPELTYQTPDVKKSLMAATVTGSVQATISPTVYATVYSLVPLEFAFNVNAGIEFTKATARRSTALAHQHQNSPSTSKLTAQQQLPQPSFRRIECSGLKYKMFSSLDFQFRVAQIKTPDEWTPDLFQALPLCQVADTPCIGNLKFVCLTADDSYYGRDAGTTVLKVNEDKCREGDSTFCECSKYSADTYKKNEMYSADADTVYWLKYPKTGMLKIFDKAAADSLKAGPAGCLTTPAPPSPAPPSPAPPSAPSATAASINKKATFPGTLANIKPTEFKAAFKKELVTKINANKDSTVAALTEAMITNVKLCLNSAVKNGVCPTGKVAARRSDEIAISYTITPTSGTDANLYSTLATDQGTAATTTVKAMSSVQCSGCNVASGSSGMSDGNIAVTVIFVILLVALILYGIAFLLFLKVEESRTFLPAALFPCVDADDETAQMEAEKQAADDAVTVAQAAVAAAEASGDADALAAGQQALTKAETKAHEAAHAVDVAVAKCATNDEHKSGALGIQPMTPMTRAQEQKDMMITYTSAIVAISQGASVYSSGKAWEVGGEGKTVNSTDIDVVVSASEKIKGPSCEGGDAAVNLKDDEPSTPRMGSSMDFNVKDPSCDVKAPSVSVEVEIDTEMNVLGEVEIDAEVETVSASAKIKGPSCEVDATIHLKVDKPADLNAKDPSCDVKAPSVSVEVEINTEMNVLGEVEIDAQM